MEDTAIPNFQDLYQQTLSPQQPPQPQVPQARGMPTPREFFTQFVNRKIPVLINNPFAPFPIENELASARAFFTGGMMMGQLPIPPPETQTPAGPDPMSQFKDILESSDPDMLRQLKDSLSPSVVSKLQSVFGSEGTPPPFDLSKIPPELMASFMGRGQGQGAAQDPGTHAQYAAAAVGGNYEQLSQAEAHPLAHQSGVEMMEHFQQLQQQFAVPPSHQHPYLYPYPYDPSQHQHYAQYQQQQHQDTQDYANPNWA